MIGKYKIVSIIYGGEGRKYASLFHNRIEELSKKERYPISSKMIMESILTQELLEGVINLFRESEFCVAFLTADDFGETKNGAKKRIRQNIVFELGMAIFHLGRERCILLSDFDTSDPSFELPSDMTSLSIRSFNEKSFSEVMNDVIEKILKTSSALPRGACNEKEVPQYDKLFQREEYRVDYENIFPESLHVRHLEGSGFLKDTLASWLEECENLPYYDEKCIYIFERIGFLPMFGRIKEAKEWLWKSAEMLEHYQRSDINYYGGTELLDFAGNLIGSIIEYTQIKMVDDQLDFFAYQNLLERFLSEPVPKEIIINPLMAVVYYDYLGLTYMKLFQSTKDNDHALKAKSAFKNSLEYVKYVDMSMQIWAGFLNYNMARACTLLGEKNEACKYFSKAISIRERWLKNSKYNITVRNALSSEFFIAKIDYIDFCNKNSILSSEQCELEYSRLEKKLDEVSDVDDKLEQLLYVRRLLQTKRYTDSFQM